LLESFELLLLYDLLKNIVRSLHEIATSPSWAAEFQTTIVPTQLRIERLSGSVKYPSDALSDGHSNVNYTQLEPGRNACGSSIYLFFSRIRRLDLVSTASFVVPMFPASLDPAEWQ
jgi:hypothetical protein